MGRVANETKGVNVTEQNANEKPEAKAKAKTPISKEQAEAEFNQMAEDWDLFIDEDNMSDDDLDGFQKEKGRIINAFMRGRATYQPDGAVLNYELSSSMGDLAVVKFEEPTGAAWVKMGEGGNSKKSNNVVRVNRFLGESTGVATAVFGKMKGSDYKFCQAVALLFLGS